MPSSPVSAFLDRLTLALAEDRVGVSDDARDRAHAEFGWGLPEIMELLYLLDEGDFSETMPSAAPEGGVIWVFLPDSGQGRLWLRLCERGVVVVVSLHRG